MGKYKNAIKNWPEDEHPREKLLVDKLKRFMLELGNYSKDGQPQGKDGQPQGVAPTVKTIWHNRRSVRLAGYDYSKEGMYFVTVCTQNRECLLGKIIEGKMELNNAGNMVKTVWNELPKFYPDVAVDVCQIMPNHIHGIIVLVGAGPCACPNISRVCKQFPYDNNDEQLSLPDVVHRFKTMTTRLYIGGVKNDKWPRFSGKLWQRNYYEHIIRDEDDLSRICNYVVDNPLKWEEDEYYV